MLGRVAKINPDVLLLQEVRATPEQIDAAHLDALRRRFPHAIWHPAEKPGYSGTATFSKLAFDDHRFGLARTRRGHGDHEGRVIEARITAADASVRVVNMYLPSGSSSEKRQAIKDRWLEDFDAYAPALRRGRVPTLICGDLNVARDHRDIFHAKANEKSSGFLPHERAWFGRLIEDGWHDTVRDFAGDVRGPFTWWSNRGRARELDRGWRIDHVLTNRTARRCARDVTIHRELSIGCSDHAPVTVALDLRT